MKKLVFLIALCVAPLSIFSNEHFVEFWQRFTLRNWKKDPFAIDTYFEYRFFDPLSKLRRFQISERFIWNAGKYLELRTNLTFILNKGPTNRKFLCIERLELEINPHIPLSRDFNLITRNRFEMIKRQHESKINWVSRHRLLLEKTFGKNAPIKSVNTNNEIFYNYLTNRFYENRWTLFEVWFDLSKDVQMSVYTIWRSIEADAGWNQSYIFGSQVDF